MLLHLNEKFRIAAPDLFNADNIYHIHTYATMTTDSTVGPERHHENTTHALDIMFAVQELNLICPSAEV